MPPSPPTGSSSRSDVPSRPLQSPGTLIRGRNGLLINERGAKTVKKDNAKPPKRHNDQKADTVQKRGGAGVAQRTGDSLTCNEAQVEALLSEGEST